MGGKKKRVGMKGNVLEVRDYNIYIYITELIGKRKNSAESLSSKIRGQSSS